MIANKIIFVHNNAVLCRRVFSTGYMIGISDADIRIALLFSDGCQVLKMRDVINVCSRSIDKISVNFNFNLQRLEFLDGSLGNEDP